MPRFYFHFSEGDDRCEDQIGCEFASLDLAYLDAYRSMIRIGADLLLEQKNPSRQCIDITDGAGVSLIVLRFDEVFRGRRERPPSIEATSNLKDCIAHGRRLREEIRVACAQAKASTAAARATMDRAQAMRFRTPLGS